MLERMVVIDTETGGLNPSVNPIVSLAAVVVDKNFVPLDTLQMLINEGQQAIVAEEAMRIHRISRQDIAVAGVKPPEVIKRFHSWLLEYFPLLGEERIVLAGHNVYFDRGFLMRLYGLAGADFDKFFSRRMIDSAAVYGFLSLVGLVPETDLSSDSIFANLGILPAQRSLHAALSDALLTTASLRIMLQMLMSSPRASTTMV